MPTGGLCVEIGVWRGEFSSEILSVIKPDCLVLVDPWRSFDEHDDQSFSGREGDIKMDGLMLFTLLVGVVAFTGLYVWLVMHRTRAMAMEDLLESSGLDEALEARRAEGVAR